MSNILLPGRVLQELKSGDTAPGAVSLFLLSDMADDYVFFNHGALFAFAEFKEPEEDPVNDWYAQQPPNTVLIKQPFERPIFEGITSPCYNGRLTWDNVICAVTKESWKSLFPFLCGIAAHNPRKKTYYQVFPAVALVLDPGEVERYGLLHPRVRRITVTVFCVDGNVGRWQLQEPRTAVAPPRMVRGEPDPRVVNIANDIFAGDLSKLSTKENPAFAGFLEDYQRVLREGPKITGINHESNLQGPDVSGG